jgi:hypothetical protein
MRDTKPFASLSSGLLARKGAAKPAMRPQGFGSFGGSLEDLGWNDMGQAPDEEPVATPACGLTPVGRTVPDGFEPEPAEAEPASVEPISEAVAAPHSQPVPEPVVVAHQRALRESFPPASVVALPRRRGEPKTGNAKAAFTLRLDPERHLKLRLACAIGRRSAQQLVTEALDTFLESLPEIEAMAERLPPETGTHGR